jgi:RNA polymerase sigma factor (TIGR02999 family)
LLKAWSAGDQEALNKLLPLVHDELHRLARRYMRRERTDHVLQTTALINEAYLRFVQVQTIEWKDRAHFFAISANMMRRILVEFARSRGYKKRSGKIKKISTDERLIALPEGNPDLVKLDDALHSLAEVDPRKAKVVELRFFGGLSVEEAAVVLQVSPQTVMRDWRLAKVWLLCELKDQK